MKEHLSRDNVRKRLTMQAQKAEAAVAAERAAENAAYSAAQAAASAAEAGMDGSSQAGSAAAPEAPAPAADGREEVEPDMEVDVYSGTAKWGESLGVPKELLAAEATRALNAPPALVPTDELELSWLYGCSSRHTRAAVHYSKDGTIVYPAGCVGVIYDKVANAQVHAMPHSDVITALDVHVLSGLAVSAHKGNDHIHACVWNTADGSIRRYLDCGAVNGVSAVRFSPDAAYIALTCQDADHTVLLFSTADGRRCATYRNGPKKPLCLAFSLAESANTLRILQGGALHFKFLTFYAGRSTITGKTGAYGADVKKTNVNCVCALPLQPGADGAESSGNEFLMGMADGTIGVVAKGDNKASAFTAAMKGSITAMYVVKLRDGTAEEAPAYKVVVGGTNGLLKVLDQELQPLSEWNLYLTPYGLLPLGRVRGFKSLCVDKLNRKILYATAGGEVGEVDLQTGADVNKGPLVHGHFRDQLHALCAHPLRQECITAGDDKTLRVWHLDTHTMATFIDLPDIARCATYSPNGHLVVAGLGGEVPGHGRTPRPMRGKVVVVSYLQGALRLVHTAGDAKDTVTAVLFTPDGSKLLASSMDGNVYIYDALNNFQLLLALTGQHKEGIRSMDISESGQYVTTCGEYSEFFVWDLSTAAVVRPSDRFEVLAATGLDWSVRQAPFGLNSVGVFPEYSDPADVLTLNQSKDHKLLAVGDSFGALKLFRNPSTEFFAPHKHYVCHSPGGVSKVAFTVKDQFLVSAGRYDRVLAQWRVVKCADLPDPKQEQQGAVSTAAVPEEDYSATYTLRGVNFAEEIAADAEGQGVIRVQLSAIVGSGTSPAASAAAALLRAAFFGQGDLLTANGRLPVLLDVSGSGAQKVLFAPATEEGVSPYANPAQQQVSTFAVTPSGKFAAIGHAAGAEGVARFAIVGAPSGQLVSELSSHVPGGVLSASFSEDGSVCACLAGDVQHSLHVFRTFTGTWEDAAHLATAQVSAGNISLLGFIPTQASVAALSAFAAAHALPPAPEAAEGEEAAPVPPPSAVSQAAAAPQPTQYHLVTAGAGHIKFWRIVGQNLYCTCGDYGADLMNKPVFTALAALLGGAYFRAQVVTGDSEGALHFWRGAKKVNKIAHHHAAVTALRAFGSFSEGAPPSLAARKVVTNTSNLVRATSGFVSGSNDKLVVWSTEGEEAVPTHTFPVQQLLSSCGWSSAIYLHGKLNSANFITSIDTDPACARLAVSFSSSPIITLAKDSRTVQKISEGHARTAAVTAVVSHPTEPNTVLTLSSDGTVRLWDVSASTVVGAAGPAVASNGALIGALQLHHAPTAAVFLNATTLFVAVSGADTNGNSGAIFVVTLRPNDSNEFIHGKDCRYHMKIVSRLHNVGTGALLQLRVSPGYKFLAAACSDGCAYMFRLEGVDGAGNLSHPALTSEDDAVSETKGDDLAGSAFVPLGFLLAHPSGAPVAGVDFSADERFARTFSENTAKINGKVEVNFFDLAKADAADEGARVHAGSKLQDPAAVEQMKTLTWASVSSPAASEVRGVNYNALVVAQGENAGAVATVLTGAQVSSVSTSAASAGSPLVCASYEDGSVSLYR
jgi:WD40 repeat protein